MSDASTRTDRIPDAGQVDLGYHYPYDTREAETTRCKIIMPSADYGPGDLCYCDILVTSTSFDQVEGLPLFVILDVAGILFFAPEF